MIDSRSSAIEVTYPSFIFATRLLRYSTQIHLPHISMECRSFVLVDAARAARVRNGRDVRDAELLNRSFLYARCWTEHFTKRRLRAVHHTISFRDVCHCLQNLGTVPLKLRATRALRRWWRSWSGEAKPSGAPTWSSKGGYFFFSLLFFFF